MQGWLRALRDLQRDPGEVLVGMVGCAQMQSSGVVTRPPKQSCSPALQAHAIYFSSPAVKAVVCKVLLQTQPHR